MLMRILLIVTKDVLYNSEWVLLNMIIILVKQFGQGP